MSALFLFDYLMTLAVVALSWGIYHAAQPPPANADRKRDLLAMSATAAGSWAEPAAAPAETQLAETLQKIRRRGGYPSPEAFIEGAKQAYESIIKAYASGNLAEVALLLSDEVRTVFADAIAERNARGETVSLLFIGFRSVEITDADLDNGLAWIELRFVAELVTATRDREGRVIAGHPAMVVDIAETWTFERHLSAASPKWILAGTDAAA